MLDRESFYVGQLTHRSTASSGTSRLKPLLTESRKENFLPAFCVNSPAHFGFGICAQRRFPHRAIAIILGYTQTIHHCHTTRQFTLGFNLDIVLAPFGPDRRSESKAHGYRIRQRNSVLSRLNFVRLPGVAIAFDRKAS